MWDLLMIIGDGWGRRRVLSLPQFMACPMEMDHIPPKPLLCAEKGSSSSLQSGHSADMGPALAENLAILSKKKKIKEKTLQF
jgi:hypothetical protein